MTQRDRLLQQIEDFRSSREMSERAFSIAATGNPKFLSRFRQGISTLRSIEAVENYLKNEMEQVTQ
ncbi:hypothetical protein IGS75_01340 [Gluconobacter sphaericus]|uniref:hypothetical protein n=1 Tax=Gluconobacter sphaericus TaxID=574987 RepID=UPI0019242121|nr:hypothetical protein [Gluconobacter sphaericus]QQX91314.1 hypothetical protein IGS75_01340 [Gluconobacter sphaericus]